MADQQETIVIDDREMFQSAMDDAPQEQIPEQPRDEQGRFAPKTDEAEPVEPVKETVAATPDQAAPAEQPTGQPKDDETASIPPWRLRETREERDAARKEAQEATRASYELQQQLQSMSQRLQKFETPTPEPVDFFADPDKSVKQQIDPLKSDIDSFKAEIRLDMSRELAAIKFGEPAVVEMETALSKAIKENHPDVPMLAARMRASKNPAAVCMDWHKNQKVVTEIGGDLAAYKERIRQEALKDPEFVAKAMEGARNQAGAAPGSRPNIQLPPSLNKAAGSGNSNSAMDSGDMSDRSLFKQAIAR